jgi:hypothetical protein
MIWDEVLIEDAVICMVSIYRPPSGNVDPDQVGIAFHFVGECNWSNLRYWIKAVYFDKVGGLMHAENGDQVGLALVGLFSVVESGASWQQVKSALSGLRKMMGLLDEDWLVD